LVYLGFYILNRKVDPFLDRVFIFIIALDFYLAYQLVVFSEVHEKYGANGPALILRQTDPITGDPVNVTTYPLSRSGDYYQAVLALSQIQYIVLQYIFVILMILALFYLVYVSTKKLTDSAEGKL